VRHSRRAPDGTGAALASDGPWLCL
jgi:hypothetical protein